MAKHTLLPCPFCGWHPGEDEDDLLDVLHRSGTWWADRTFYGKTYRIYRRHSMREEGDSPCWSMNCTENMGGCGAEITGDSEAEVVAKWNRRTSPTN